MFDHGVLEGDALGDGGTDVIGRQVVHQVVLHQQGSDGEAAYQVAGQRQDRMTGDVLDLLPGAEFVEI